MLKNYKINKAYYSYIRRPNLFMIKQLKNTFLLLLFSMISSISFGQFYNGSNQEFGKNRIQYKEFQWQYYQFEKFDVYFYEGGMGLANHIASIAEKQIKEIENDLKEVVKLDVELSEKIERISEVKGLSFITTIGIIAEYNGFILFENRNQVTSFAGYDVVLCQSGTSIKGRPKISKKGNSYVRQMMYMPAMCSAVHEEHNRTYYKRIVSKTGIKMKANVAIQRKLLLLIYSLFKSGESYNPNHYLVMQKRLKPQNKLKKELELI